MALALEYPWKLNNVDFIEEDGQKVLSIDIGFEKGAKFSDPDTGEPCPVHDTMERRWRHLNFFEHTCYIHCKVPRVICNDSKVKQVGVPWARKASGFTMLFEAYSMMLIECEMPVNRVGETMREYPNRIWTIFDHWVGQAYKKADHSQVTQLGVDETSSRKGHSYITTGVDMDERRVIHATEGKGADTRESIKDYLEIKQTPSEQISQVCIDLSPAFISGVECYFPDAQITFDRFHVKALGNKAMDEVRKSERRRHVELKGHKYTFLKSAKQLTEAQSVQRHALVELYPTLGEAYRLKELFDDFLDHEDPARSPWVFSLLV